VEMFLFWKQVSPRCSLDFSGANELWFDELLIIIEPQNGLGWKGLLKVMQSMGRDISHSIRLLKSPIQTDLQHFQWWGIYNFSGQPGPVSNLPHPEEFLPYVQSKSIVSVSNRLVLSLQALVKTVSVFLISPL